jgi:hypothetical protein
MFLQFLGVNNKILNFSLIVLIEDESTDEESKVKITTIDGSELEFVDDDADVILARAETLMDATNLFILQLQSATNN